MEEESKMDRSSLLGNKDRFSFTMSHKKLLGYVGNQTGTAPTNGREPVPLRLRVQ